MEIQFFRTLCNNQYSVKIKLILTPLETDKVKFFGKPSVDVGGDFGTLPGITYTLPNQFRSIPSGFPYTQTFSGDDDVDAKDKALIWQAEMQTRLDAAIDTVASQTDDFTGETRVQV